MAYRELVDDGEVWVVFSTQPGSGANVRPQYANGWLSFQRGADRRRLSPIPSGWEHAGDDQLLAWLQGAQPVAQAWEDDEAFAEARPEPLDRRADDGEPHPGDRRETADSGTAGPASRVHKSIERIRAMLSTIRRDSV